MTKDKLPPFFHTLKTSKSKKQELNLALINIRGWSKFSAFRMD